MIREETARAQPALRASTCEWRHQESYTYDPDRMLRTQTRPDSVQIVRTPDSAGRLDTVQIPGGMLDYEYYPPGMSGAQFWLAARFLVVAPTLLVIGRRSRTNLVISSVPAFPTSSQTIFGGGPSTNPRCRK